ncbi:MULTISPECIES: hypothetical protein [Xanthomonas]|uniref:Uncharacterized protein n=1 Tax=Xanthomonas campestris pv. glycines TaxID=473421 RepID=Q32X90_XANCG|nr:MULTISPECIES: hypothetical protein [Xanthomonas]AAX12231.1 hypothetical protein [Xanthomonas citri pv. glycines]AOY65052.1 hypothetical protein BHE84_22925 [Xanthomonas citri pv. glycines str. 8ra]ARV25442.1 hypothetical protein A9D66_23280 [Xanthomonas citri pv. glycines str. 12-2]KLC41129.1 hypothetical protein XP1815_22145 [Xanthomonas perforans]MBZ2552403.1 hypothetical protein [Xanthomonas perforans]
MDTFIILLSITALAPIFVSVRLLIVTRKRFGDEYFAAAAVAAVEAVMIFSWAAMFFGFLSGAYLSPITWAAVLAYGWAVKWTLAAAGPYITGSPYFYRVNKRIYRGQNPQLRHQRDFFNNDYQEFEA